MTLADLQQREAQHHLDVAAGQLSGSGKRVVTEIRGADVAEGLLTAAREEGTDLLVIGSHTHSRMERFFLGSVSETVAHHAPCSVLVVR
jgi:nucleotide-binding universal stress UspA family protein